METDHEKRNVMKTWPSILDNSSNDKSEIILLEAIVATV
jgi:hypothetical protein